MFFHVFSAPIREWVPFVLGSPHFGHINVSLNQSYTQTQYCPASICGHVAAVFRSLVLLDNLRDNPTRLFDFLSSKVLR